MVVSQVPLNQRSIRYVKGVGPHRVALMGQLEVESVEDLCYYAPRRYEDRSHLAAIGDLQAGCR